MWSLIYVLTIVAVNYGFSVVPLVELPWGDLWPPMSLLVGLVFVVRDFAQREVGHGVIPLMLIGGALSYVLADPYVAVASVVAFLASEFADWAIYTFTNKPFHQRIVWSSAVSTPIDSVVFLGLIGAASAGAVAIMVASKMLAAIAVAYWWGRPSVRDARPAARL